MTLQHGDRLEQGQRPEQERLHQCVLCGRKYVGAGFLEDGLCKRCQRAKSCARCGQRLKKANLEAHQSSTKCIEQSIEHMLWVRGWHRCGTLSTSLKVRGFVVHYVPRWIGDGGHALLTPVSHHPERWKKQPEDLGPPRPPRWPAEEYDAALERFDAHRILLALRGRNS